MKNLLLCISFLILLGCGSTAVKQSDKADPAFVQADSAFAELKTALDKDNGHLWQHSLEGPVLMVDPETREIIANQADAKGELKRVDNCYTGTFPENKNTANTDVEWNGTNWTMVKLPLPETKAERLNLLIHECFHRIQPLIGFDSLSQIQCNHLDSREGRIYMKLELEALNKALQAKNPEEDIRNAILFRLYRQKEFPGARQAENSLEINEGLAEYTGSILSGRNDNELRQHYISAIKGFFGRPTFVRSFAYYTIPVYGYFMQKSDPEWNLKINKLTDLTDFISNFYSLDPDILDNKQIREIGKSYGLDSITNFENKREEERIRKIKKYKDLFTSDSVLSIDLINMHIGFNPGNLVPLDLLGTVYPNLRITDNWGILEVDSVGALLSPEWNNVRVACPEVITDSLITGRGYSLKLNSSWKLEKRNRGFVVEKK